MYLNRKKILFLKRVSEPNFCEPSSHIFSVNFDLWFTSFQSSQISRVPVNHGSQITPAPKGAYSQIKNDKMRALVAMVYGN
jgi:hypothetical protein